MRVVKLLREIEVEEGDEMNLIPCGTIVEFDDVDSSCWTGWEWFTLKSDEYEDIGEVSE